MPAPSPPGDRNQLLETAIELRNASRVKPFSVVLGGVGVEGTGRKDREPTRLCTRGSPLLSVKAGLLALGVSPHRFEDKGWFLLAFHWPFRCLSAGLEAGSQIPSIFLLWYLYHFRVRLLHKQHTALPQKPALPRIFSAHGGFLGSKPWGYLQATPTPRSLQTTFP